MLETVLEYLTSIYVLPILATIIGLCIVYIYDLFEKKQYSNSVYFRIGLLIYISCLATLYISRLPMLQPGGTQLQSGGGGVNQYNTQSFMPQPNEVRNSFETFKTGIPTF